jgi:tRNA-splicing ligase RtcB
MTEPYRDLTIFGEADDATVEQMNNCLDVQPGAKGVLCADNHRGYAQPVGGVVAYRERISVSGVGYDIGCGNKAVQTNLRAADVDIAGVMDEVERRVAFGIGPNPGETAPDHPVLDSIRTADFAPQRALLDKAANQLGTVGGGNHYVDLFEDESGWLWIGVHFGSRGFGHTTANGFMWMSRGKPFQTKGECKEDLMATPITFRTDSFEGEAYIAAMQLAGEYAYAGRDVVVDRVLDILGAEAVFGVHNHHNYAWIEKHFGESFYVVRKGATPAWPGQLGFVGSTMGEDSVILRGYEEPSLPEGAEGINLTLPAAVAAQRAALYSTVHGAGRAMSRKRAAGKQRKRWSCLNRDCDWTQGKGEHKPQDDTCPKCGNDRLRKRWVQMEEGEVDWPATVASLRSNSIELRGGGAEEAPLAYKRLPEVLDAMGETIDIVHTLRPLGVAMAPNGVPADD